MGTKNNPGTYDCYANADPDEPMFILLGRDPLAPAAVLEWARRREETRGPSAKVDDARACARSMVAWQERIATAAVAAKEAMNMSNIPIARRADPDRLTPAERAISEASFVIETLPVDLRLTRARARLVEAASLVADYVDGVPAEERAPEAWLRSSEGAKGEAKT